MNRLLWTSRNCPFLEVLELTLYRVVESADPHLESGNMVRLAHLRRLYLDTTPHDTVTDILAHLTFPPTTSIDIEFTGTHWAPINFARGCSSFSTILASIDDIAMKISCFNDEVFDLLLESADSRVNMRWHWYICETFHDALKHIGLEALPFHSLQRLAITASSSSPLPQWQWRQVFSSIPLVVSLELTLRDSMAMVVFSALAQSPPGQPASGVVCPNLRHLIISSIHDLQESIPAQLVSCFANLCSQRNAVAVIQVNNVIEIIQ
ncbi:hypothetical protein AcW2_005347 [Taiwanofungus camphoratus]|nr:hypothetical protein AcW2_005347 [Antrodia cinnamomea]